MNCVRNSAKAIIIVDDKLLAIKNHTQGEDWYILPGGGQNHRESLVEALKRECLEEACIDVVPGDILFIRDYIAMNHQFAEEDGDAHQVEFMFQCTIPEDSEPRNGPEKDEWQTDVVWLPLDEIDDYDLYPCVLKTLLVDLNRNVPDHPIYLGDVN